MNVSHALVVFVAAFAADITWAFWAIHTSSHRPLSASIWAVAIVALGAVNIDAIATSAWYVVPSALGAGVGTFCAVYVDRYRKGRNVQS